VEELAVCRTFYCCSVKILHLPSFDVLPQAIEGCLIEGGAFRIYVEVGGHDKNGITRFLVGLNSDPFDMRVWLQSRLQTALLRSWIG